MPANYMLYKPCIDTFQVQVIRCFCLEFIEALRSSYLSPAIDKINSGKVYSAHFYSGIEP